MSKRTLLAAATAAVCLALITALPASAAPPPGVQPPPNGDTATTFTLTGGALYVSAPAAADLGTGSAGTANQPLTGSLGDVFVIDDRAALAVSWNASVNGTNFTTGGGTPAETVPGGNISYATGTIIDSLGNPSFISGPPTTLQPGGTVMTASGGSGSNAVQWNPTLTVHPTNQVAAGTYSGTVFHSVS
jgi:hypothetical protein